MKEANQESKQETIELVDCGRASEKTHGTMFMVLFELGSPPFDKLLLL